MQVNRQTAADIAAKTLALPVFQLVLRILDNMSRLDTLRSHFPDMVGLVLWPWGNLVMFLGALVLLFWSVRERREPSKIVVPHTFGIEPRRFPGKTLLISCGLGLTAAVVVFASSLALRPHHQAPAGPQAGSTVIAPAARDRETEGSKGVAVIPARQPSASSDTTATGQERKFTNRTPRELLALYEGRGRTALQADKLIDPYKGLWITVEAMVEQVIPDTAGNTVVLRTQPARDLINARFSKEWDAQLSRINTGDQITIHGKISETQNGQQLYLVECEMQAVNSRVAHTLSRMYAPHEHAQHLCHRVLSMACPGFRMVPQGGMSAPPAKNTLVPVTFLEFLAAATGARIVAPRPCQAGHNRRIRGVLLLLDCNKFSGLVVAKLNLAMFVGSGSAIH